MQYLLPSQKRYFSPIFFFSYFVTLSWSNPHRWFVSLLVHKLNLNFSTKILIVIVTFTWDLFEFLLFCRVKKSLWWRMLLEGGSVTRLRGDLFSRKWDEGGWLAGWSELKLPKKFKAKQLQVLSKISHSHKCPLQKINQNVVVTLGNGHYKVENLGTSSLTTHNQYVLFSQSYY